jgi:hypothetical protein
MPDCLSPHDIAVPGSAHRSDELVERDAFSMAPDHA